MSQSSKIWLFTTRVVMGWLMFYAGITKVIDPTWSAEGYLKSAKTFAAFYAWLASPAMLPITNFVNEWGLTLLGVSLIFGSVVRLSSVLGAVLMVLYYFPVLEFPYVAHGFLVDEHIIYAAILMYFYAARAGRIWGFGAKCENWPLCKKYPALHNWLD